MALDPIRIGLPKGRILDAAMGLLGRAGFDLSALANGNRELLRCVSHSQIGDVEFAFLRASDMLPYVEHGACAIGVVGSDQLLEHDPNLFIPVDLQIGKCRIVLACPEGVDPTALSTPRIATKYPKVTADYFSRTGAPPKIIHLSGAIEIAPKLGLADAIVDIVETGTTLRENGLIEFATLVSVSSRLVVNRAAFKLDSARVRNVIDIIKGAVASA